MGSDNDLALLHQKIDYLTEQVEAQCRNQQALDELRQDLVPVLNHMFRLTVKELDEIDSDFTLEDILHLLKRLLRDTRRISQMLDRLEMLMAFIDEFQFLSKPMFDSAVENLDVMEQKGYFDFVRGGQYVLDQVAAEFGEEDVRALGDNIAAILSTIRNMTQPDVMALANNLVDAMRTEAAPDEKVSLWRLWREMNDPKVRAGLVRLLRIVKAFSETDSLPSQEKE